MRLSRRFDTVLTVCTITSVIAALAAFVHFGVSSTASAESEDNEVTYTGSSHFVTFFDRGQKLTVKTTAATVGEALERAKITYDPSDQIEPSVDTEIDANNFYINIYRAHPVVLIDGMTRTYLMSANSDPKTIMREAGITVYDGDEIKLNASKFDLQTGVASVYEVFHKGGQTITEDVEIPFEQKKIKDYNLPVGTEEVREFGELGVKRMVYKVNSVDGVEAERYLLSETVVKEPVARVVAVGASAIEKNPLTAARGRNVYTVTKPDGSVVTRHETFYDLPMRGVMGFCGGGSYYIREDGVKVDKDGYILVAADLSRYPRCSVVETSLGSGKVYDTGSFALTNPEQFDIATDWTNRDGV